MCRPASFSTLLWLLNQAGLRIIPRKPCGCSMDITHAAPQRPANGSNWSNKRAAAVVPSLTAEGGRLFELPKL